jgi:hypothetical protein
MFRKTLVFVLSFCLIFSQISFAGAIGQVNMSGYLSQMKSAFVVDKFRPLHLRYFSYDIYNNNFRILLDKGDVKDLSVADLAGPSKELLKYFLIGVSLPDDVFWVNLRPDSEDSIIDEQLAQTDIGKILLEADLQLKKDTALFTSPETPEGRIYWNKIYKKAQEIFGSENVTIPTLTRPWIVPDDVIIRQDKDSAYVYKATLKVMLEQDRLKSSETYNFKDERLKQLNEYSAQIIRESIIPKLTKEVNSSKRYAALRQVYYSLILARWFKAKFNGKSGEYSKLINTGNLDGLVSSEPWSKSSYFKAYKDSFDKGEYDLEEPVFTPSGKVIRSYFSGGISWQSIGNSGFQSPESAAPDKLVSGGRVVGFDGNASSSALKPVEPKVEEEELDLDEPGKGPGGGPIIEGANRSVREANSLIKSKKNESLASARQLLIQAIEGDDEEGTIGYKQIMEEFPEGDRMHEAAKKNMGIAQGLLEQAGGSKNFTTVSVNSDKLVQVNTPDNKSKYQAVAKYSIDPGVYEVVTVSIMREKGKDGMHYLVLEGDFGALFAIPLGTNPELAPAINLINKYNNSRSGDGPYIYNGRGSIDNVSANLIKALEKETEAYYAIGLDEPGKGPGGGPIIEGANNKVREATELLDEGPQGVEPSGLGGIDFRTMDMLVQPMGSFSGLSFKLPKITNPELVNADKEFLEIRNMVDRGMIPSGERIKELIAVCLQQRSLDTYSDDMIVCLADIFSLQEDNLMQSSPELKEALVILDSNKFVI